jgi:streptogramin lyase
MRLYRPSQRMQPRLSGAVKATHICPASWVLVVSVLAGAMGLSRADAAPCYYQGDVVSCFSDSKCYSYCDPCAGTPYCFEGQCGTSSVPLDCNDHNDCTSDLCIQDCTDPFWTGQGLHCQPMFSGSPLGTYGCIHKPIAGCAGPTSTPGRTATVRSTLTPTRTPTRANTPTHTLVPTATPPPPTATKTHTPRPTAPPLSITEFHIGGGPIGITTGPDGNLWFAENSAQKAGVLSPDGELVTEYSLSGSPGSIVQGPGGQLWFTECDVGKIGNLTTPRVFLDEYPVGYGTLRNACAPQSLAIGTGVGMTYDMWFVESGGLGRFDATHQHVEDYGIPGGPFTNHGPHSITLGPDNAMWFTDELTDMIGRLDPLFPFTATEFPLPAQELPHLPDDITNGPDNALWFSENSDKRIGRIALNGSVSEFPVSSHPRGITTGPDGNLWFVESGGGYIDASPELVGRLTPSGVLTELPIPTENSDPAGITAGPDGNVWFTEHASDIIARVELPKVPTPTPTPGSCIGDCDGSRDVTINELITMVNIALGGPQPSACPDGVPSGTEVDIALIIQAVNNALNGCSG